MKIFKALKLNLPKMILIVLFLFVAVGAAQAATYYVATSGNNSNAGTQAQPWLTIQKAANTMVAGDTVYIRGGTYTERVTPQHSGSVGNYITYQNYQGETAIIHSPNTWTNDYAFYLPDNVALSYIRIKGLTIENANHSNIHVEAYTQPKSHIIIDGCTLQGNSFAGVFFRMGVTDSQIINNTITGVQYGIFAEYKNSNILIDNNTISYNVVHRTDIDNHFAFGIEIHSWGVPSRPNTDIIISNNEVHHALVQGIQVGGRADRIWVKNNWFHHNGATGIQMEGNVGELNTNIVVEGNTCEYNGNTNDWETGIWIDEVENGLVQNNIIRYNKNGSYISSGANIIYRRNLIYGNTKFYGFVIGAGTAAGSNNVIFTHNTLYGHAGTEAALNFGWWYETIEGTNYVLKNNIISNTASPMELNKAIGTGTTHQMDYNNYYNTRAVNFNWGGSKTWAQYLSASGKDAHSIATDPKFTNAGNGDFTLQSGSGDINTGTFLTTTVGGGTGTVITLADARYFQDGYGISGMSGDTIRVGSNTVTITDINYTTKQITVTPSISWSSGDGVSYKYSGSKPDMGAYEYGGTQIPPTPPPTNDTIAPSTPAGLTATAISSSQINLSWTASTDNVGVTGYKVYKNGNLVATLTKTTYSDTGLLPSTSYTYRVSAYDAAGNVSGQSAVSEATTKATTASPIPPSGRQFTRDIEAPTVPTNVTAQASSTSIINLSWSASKDNVAVVGYKIYQNGKLRGITTRTNYSDTGLSSGTTYRYYISAYDAVGNTSNSSSSIAAITK